jgi:hypothetical protein
LGLFYAKLLGNDFFNACFDIAHIFPLRVVDYRWILPV